MYAIRSYYALSGDGSSRMFFKIKTESTSYCGVLPASENTQKGLAEAHAAVNIGNHLKKRGIPVPVIYAFDPVSGFILFEDLGDILLHDHLQEKKRHTTEFPDHEIVELVITSYSIHYTKLYDTLSPCATV